MTRAFAAAALAVLCAVPSRAATPSSGEFVAFQRRALGAYVGESLAELERARVQLESLQEFGLDPHAPDLSVAVALRRIDRAEALVRSASSTLNELVGVFAPPPAALAGWTPIEPRIDAALALIDRSTVAAEVARLYRSSLPVEVYPCPGSAIALYSPAAKAVRVRGYYGVNRLPVEFLAAILVHEGTHALQDRRLKGNRKFEAGLTGEREAREAEARFWRELGAPPAGDFFSTEGDQLAAYARGPAAFDGFVHEAYRRTPFWSWVEPVVPVPSLVASAPGAGLKRMAEEAAPRKMTPREAAKMVRSVRELEASIARNFRLAAGQNLGGARERLAQVPELLAPYPRIVNMMTMSMRAESMDGYPMTMRLGHGLIAVALDELDAARAALARGRVEPEEAERLRREREWLAPEGPSDDPALRRTVLARLDASATGRPLAELWRKKGYGAALVAWADPALEIARPERLLFPGRLFARRPQTDVGAAWAAHLLVHRRQGLAPGAAPSPAQEEEAVAAACKVWIELGEPDVKSWSATGHRLLAPLAVWEGGEDDLLRLYLRARRVKPSERSSKEG